MAGASKDKYTDKQKRQLNTSLMDTLNRVSAERQRRAAAGQQSTRKAEAAKGAAVDEKRKFLTGDLRGESAPEELPQNVPAATHPHLHRRGNKNKIA